MNIVLRLTLDDIFSYGILVILLILLLIGLAMIGIGKLIEKFKGWKKKVFGKKDDHAADSGRDGK